MRIVASTVSAEAGGALYWLNIILLSYDGLKSALVVAAITPDYLHAALQLGEETSDDARRLANWRKQVIAKWCLLGETIFCDDTYYDIYALNSDEEIRCRDFLRARARMSVPLQH